MKIQLGTVASLVRDSYQPSSNGKNIYVGLEHIEPGRIHLKLTGKESDVKSNKTKFKPGHILYGKLRPYLDKCVLAEIDGICSTDILVLETNEKAINSFIAFLLHSDKFVNYAKQTTSGVNHPRTSWQAIQRFEFILPDLRIQGKVSEALLKIQNAIEAQESYIAKLQIFKSNVMQFLFTHGTKGEKTIMTEIGEIPLNWSLVRLGDVCKTSSGGTPSRARKDYYIGDIPWFKSGEMNDSYVDDSEEKITKTAVQESSAKLFPSGTLLIAMYGATAGKTAITRREATSNQAVCAIFENNEVNLEFVRNILIYRRTFLLDQRHGGAQPNLSQTSIQNLVVPLPARPEQNKIAEALVSVEQKIENSKKKLAIYNTLFKTLLNELMNAKRKESIGHGES